MPIKTAQQCIVQTLRLTEEFAEISQKKCATSKNRVTV